MSLPITELPFDPSRVVAHSDAFSVGPADILRFNEYELLTLRDQIDAGCAKIALLPAPSIEGIKALFATVISIKKIKSRSKSAATERGRIVELAQHLVSAGWAQTPDSRENSWCDARLIECLLLTRSENLARSFFNTPHALPPWRDAAVPSQGLWFYGALDRLTAAGWIAGALIASNSLTPKSIRIASARPDSFFSSLLNPPTWQAIGGPAGARILTTAWMDKGWNIDAVDECGQTSLHRACTMRNADAVALLLDLGAHVALSDSNGRTPLHILSNGRARHALQCGELLLRAGANPLALDHHGQSPHDLALASNSNILPLLAPLFAALSESRALASSLERADAELGAQIRALMDGGHRLLAPDGTCLDTPTQIMALPQSPARPRRPGL